jgi:hypothetical protein
MTSLPTYTKEGVSYTVPNLLSTVRHMPQSLAIQTWLITVIDTCLTQLSVGIPIPTELLDAKWTLDHLTRLIYMADTDQLKQLRILIAQPFDLT